MEDGQAHVVEERCIACGTCIRECPQGAKTFRSDLDHAIQIIEENGSVAVSIAPSFAAIYHQWERTRLPSALRMLGFKHVHETAIGAYYVAQETADYVKENPGKEHIATACPAVVNYIEQYKTDRIKDLVPVVSPMIAHAKMMKHEFGKDVPVVFIGPCVAKKAEADRKEYAGVVDCVLTFTELQDWFDKREIKIDQCEESGFDTLPAGYSRLFPLEGGSLRTGMLQTDILDNEILAVSGFEALESVAEQPETDNNIKLVEPLFCQHGCIGGPAIPDERNVYQRRQDILEYVNDNKPETVSNQNQPAQNEIDIHTKFEKRELDTNEFTEEEIRSVLEKTGKTNPEEQLNCGACGYPSCREKAIAVLRGLAEPEMCIPYMRRLAEQRTDRIMETSPNGIIIVNQDLEILNMNPAFRKYFMCSEAVLGKPVSYLMDPDPFERVASGETNLYECVERHDKYNIICHQIIYPLRDENQHVGIFVNITDLQANQDKLKRLRAETVQQAQELLQNQISMAQRIAGFLGKSTAKSEELIEQLLKMAEEERTNKNSSGGGFSWDTYTSKRM
jgi:PAS domain S-box-containing protein